MDNTTDSSSRNNPRKARFTLIATIFLILGIVVLLLIFVFNGKTTVTTSTPEKGEDNSTLICKSISKPIVFSDIDYENIEQEYRSTFTNDKLQSIFYILKAEYADEKAAERVKVRLHADHNIYMGSIDHNSEAYNPTYSVLDNDIQITSYAKKDELDIDGVKYFQIDWNKSFTLKNIKADYESLGYTCETINSNN